MRLFFDPRDDPQHERVGSRLLYWLDDLGADPLDRAGPADHGFLFAGHRGIDDYRALLADRPALRDQPEAREPLLRLDAVLTRLASAGVRLPSPATWVLSLDAPMPPELPFPLFVRTAETSWKRGGAASRVETARELADEAADLRRAFGWDAVIVVRQWLALAVAGLGRHGPLPQEVRCWVVDGEPTAWSFHHLHQIDRPTGFPPSASDLAVLRERSAAVASAFESRLVVADFARDVAGAWWFIEAGPGSCAGTAHEAAFKGVACRLLGDGSPWTGDAVGGPF